MRTHTSDGFYCNALLFPSSNMNPAAIYDTKPSLIKIQFACEFIASFLLCAMCQCITFNKLQDAMLPLPQTAPISSLLELISSSLIFPESGCSRLLCKVWFNLLTLSYTTSNTCTGFHSILLQQCFAPPYESHLLQISLYTFYNVK